MDQAVDQPLVPLLVVSRGHGDRCLSAGQPELDRHFAAGAPVANSSTVRNVDGGDEPGDRVTEPLRGPLVMDMSALAVTVEDHDELGRAVNGGEGVWCHGGGLRRLAGLDDDLALAE